MTSDRDALLAAVLAAPHDDAPRLIYADCLEESGVEADIARAQFIRAEIAAEAFPAHDPRREGHETAAAGLYNRWRHVWAGEWPDWVMQDNRLRYRYHRGFISYIHGSLSNVDLALHRLIARVPIVAVEIDHLSSSSPMTAQSWETMREFAFTATCLALKRNLVTHICNRNGAMMELETLTIHFATARLVESLRLIAQAPFRTTLKTLNLSNSHLTDADAATLAAARGLDRVTVLNVAGNDITPHGERLLRARFGDGLTI